MRCPFGDALPSRESLRSNKKSEGNFVVTSVLNAVSGSRSDSAWITLQKKGNIQAKHCNFALWNPKFGF